MQRNKPEKRHLSETSQINYASHGEDAVFIGVLNRLSWLLQSDQVGTSTYLDIGAHNPIAGSNTYLLYQLGWRGTLVEPNAHWINEYELKRKGDLVLPCAVSIDNVSKKFYKFSDLASSNTLSMAFADEIMSSQNVEIESEALIHCMTLDEIIDIHIENFDVVPKLMSIDIEGLDFDVAASFSWKIRPRFVMIEDPELNGPFMGGKMLKLMEKQGYRPIAHCLITTLYVDINSQESKALLKFGPLAVK